MSYWNKVKKTISKTYKKIDKSVGGVLPGGGSSSPSSSGSSSSDNGFSSSDPTLNTNPDFDQNIGGVIIPGSSGGGSSGGGSSGGGSSGGGSSGGGSSGGGSSGGFSSSDPTLNTNPEFPQDIGGGFVGPIQPSGGSSNQPITDTQISQALAVANQANIQSQITGIDNQQVNYQKSSSFLQGIGVVPLPTSSKSQPFDYNKMREDNKKKLEAQRMSIQKPDLKDIDSMDLMERGIKTIWGTKGKDYIPPKDVEAIINQRSTQIILEARDREVSPQINKQVDIKTQEIKDFVSTANAQLENYATRLQEDINSRKITVNQAKRLLKESQGKLNKIIEDFSETKNKELQTIGTKIDERWWDSRGKHLDKAARRIITGTEGEGIKDYFTGYKALQVYSKLNIPTLTVAVGSGFVIGGALTGGLLALEAYAGAEIASSFGLGLGIGLGVAGVGAGGTAVYSLSKQLNSGDLSKGEFVAHLITGGILTTASISGAMAGGLAVKSTINYGKLTLEEKAISEKILNRKNSIEVKNLKGGLSETQIKALKISASQKAELINQIRTGSSVQKVEIKINKAGLSPAEIKVANKLNFRGTGYQVTTSAGKSVTGASSYNIKTGRGIARFNSQRTREVTSLFSGKADNGKITGLSVSEIRTPPKRGLLRFGDRTTLNEARLELVKGTGKVKYSKVGGNTIRYEYSEGTSKLIRADVYDSKGNWIRSDLKAPTGVSKSLRVSKLYGKEGVLQGDFSTGRITTQTTNIFKDVAGKGFSGKETSFFNYERVPTKSIKGFGGVGSSGGAGTGEGLLTLQKIVPVKVAPQVPVPQSTLVTASKSTLINIKSPTPTYVGGEGGLLSYSAFSSTGTIIQLPVTTGGLASPLINQEVTKSKFNQLFVDSTAISKKQFEPQSRGVFFSPSTIPSVSQPQAEKLFVQPRVVTKKVTTLQTPKVTTPSILPVLSVPTSIVSTPTVIPGVIIPFGMGLGSPKTGGGQKGTKQKTKSSFLPEYNPSLGAILTRQKTKEVTQEQFKLLSKKKYSGLSSRSQIKIIPKKKKVKKSK